MQTLICRQQTDNSGWKGILMEKRNEARRAGAQRTRMRRKRKQNKSAVLCVSLITLMLLGVMSVQILSLYGRNQSYQEKEQELQTQLESEQQRQLELKEYEEYVKTKEYIEQTAKTKLGLAYPNEIIFKEKEKED